MKRTLLSSLVGVVIFIFLFFIFNGLSAGDGKLPISKLADTLEELEEHFPPAEVCAGCHAEIHEEWLKSMHSQSIIHSIDIIYSYIKKAIHEDPERAARLKKPGGYKAELMKCFVCHAPQLEYASEKLMKQVGQAVIDYYERKDPKAKELLDRLVVNCYVCHNMKALHPPERPEPMVMYGIKGTGKSPLHDIKRHPFIDNSNFCMQCHGAYLAPDGEPIFCSTIAQSYRDHYVPMGGHNSCQDCHMRAKNRGHTFPGTYDPEMLKEGIGFNFQVRKTFDTAPLGPLSTRQPGAVITVDLINNAGHRIPDGCYWTAKLILELEAVNEEGKVVWKTQKEFFEVGLNWFGDRRWVSYEIKDLVDFSLPPRHVTTERFYAVFPKESKKIDITAKVKYHVKKDVEFLIHEARRTLYY